jgi:cyclophilin family peptidyl-prolyl cis-trans isomerase
MGNLKTIGQVVDAELEGRVREYYYRKVPSQTTVANVWFDLSMSPGNPGPKYWFDAAPNTAKAVFQSTDGGFFHGANVSPSEKYLRGLYLFCLGANSPVSPAILCDYLMYYPSIDEGTTDEQFMDNTVTLPRYTDGKGVYMMAVSVASRVGGQQFFVNYTNSDGVAGRISGTVTMNVATAIGSFVTGSNNFIPLQYGDGGVRSVESVTMLGVDTGLFSIVLVKPLYSTSFGTVTTFQDHDPLTQKAMLPRIYDNAFLNFILLPSVSLSGVPFTGSVKCIWN